MCFNPLYYCALIGWFWHLWVFVFSPKMINNLCKSWYISLERFTALYKHVRFRGAFNANTNYQHIIPSQLATLCLFSAIHISRRISSSSIPWSYNHSELLGFNLWLQMRKQGNFFLMLVKLFNFSWSYQMLFFCKKKSN